MDRGQPGRPAPAALDGRRAAFGGGPATESALDDVDGQAALRCLLVLGLHVSAGVAHRLDDGVERDDVRAVSVQRGARCRDGLDRGDRVAFDGGHLHEAADRVAGEPEVVLHADLRSVLDLCRRAAADGCQAGGRHGARRADLTLTADLGSGDRGRLLDDRAHGTRGEQEALDALVVGALDLEAAKLYR